MKKDSQHSAFSHTELLQQEDTKQIQQTEKTQGVKCERNQEQVSKSPLLVGSDRTCLISPTLNCNNTWEVLSTRETC